MPPSSDQTSSYQHQAVDPALYPQEEARRKRSPGRKAQGKKNRRYGTGGDNLDEKGPATGLPQAMTSSPSILSQLHGSISPPPAIPNGASSPLLDAWEPTPIEQEPDSAPEPTTDWAGTIPYGRSPRYNHSSRVSVTGTPPKYQPASEGLRGGFTHVSPPISPRAAYRQPVQRASDYQSFGDYLGSSPNSRRPSSMQSHHPPPPHHSQAHFYNAPEIDFGMPKQISDDGKSLEGSCCIFDSLPFASKEGAGNPDHVLLAGFNKGLDVYHVDKKRFDHIGRLDGLRGSVIGAKLLPSGAKAGLQTMQPLVVVVVHGPYVSATNIPQLELAQGEDEEFNASRSMIQAMQEADMSHYQTTVEVHSLSTGGHVATLLRYPKVEARMTYGGQASQPPPTGDLRIQAAERFVIVSSGSSGEVYIFERAPRETSSSPHFRCVGKTWTRTTTSSRPTSVSSSDCEPGGFHSTQVRKADSAILSLSNRWLAIVPPLSSSHTTIHAQVETSGSNSKIPGLSSHTPPTEPNVTCDLDGPKDASILNQVARDVAQGALKSAQWVAAEGFQVWNNYWSKPADQNRPAGSPPNHGFTAPLPPPQNFPPTHAQDNLKDRTRGQPTLVSVLDLERLSQSQHMKPSLALQPLATFSLPLGCSTLSFSPSGLNLLTASTKGDVQYVWDLMRMVHGEAGRVGDPDATPRGPNVRQVARFSRMTEARIIDVIWTEPRGERLAIITERGTVHINDLPLSAFQWPPYRRLQRSVTPAKDETNNAGKSGDTARPQSVGSTFGSAFGMFSGRTQTALASVRGRSPSTNGGFSGFGSLAMTAGAGAKGGKAVAAGINRSVSAAAAGTVNTIRHYGENRLTLPSSLHPVSPSCAQWLGGKSQGFLAVTGGGIVRVYPIRQSSNPKPGQRRPSVVAEKPVEFSLLKSKRRSQHAPSDFPQLAGQASPFPGSFWLPQSSRPPSRRSDLDTHPLSYAEIETNAPYQPFHTDRRVNLFVYDGKVMTSSDPHHLNDSSTWTFGDAIPATKINIVSAPNDGDDGEFYGPGKMENEIRMEGTVEDEQRVVSTTTRRKKSRRGVGNEVEADDGDFFEDDCEVLDYVDQRV